MLAGKYPRAAAVATVTTETDTLRIRRLGAREYVPVWQEMKTYTESRFTRPGVSDELWLVEHPPVYTLGLNGKSEHVLHADTIAARNIPIVACDRGGQITYHGPGQVVIYTLLDLNRLNLGVKTLVYRLEQAVIALLADYDIAAQRKPEASGVYVSGAKIAALGLRVRRGFSYHGLSFNVNMDLSPFSCINPCGYAGLETTQLAQWRAVDSVGLVGGQLLTHLVKLLKNS